MRAAIFERAGQPWKIESLPDPVPGAGEAVIKVGRCGICATDLSFTSGKGFDFPCGSVLGHEYAGEVVAIGKGVATLKTGDLVTAMPVAGCGGCSLCAQGLPLLCADQRQYFGGFGEYTCIAERTTIKLPASISLADGALVEPLAVGLHGAGLAGFKTGARVLVIGPGAIGLATIYWARRLGAGRVVAAARSNARAGLAAEFGASALVQTGEGDAQQIAEALGGPPEIVFECTGAPGMLAKAIELVGPRGTVVQQGFCMLPDPMVPGVATFKEARLLFSLGYTLAEYQLVVDVLNSGAVAPRRLLGEVITLDALPQAIEAMRRGSGPVKVQVAP